MLSEESLRYKLLLDYEICKLYASSGVSTKTISEYTGVSLATVKRALKSLSERKEDYLKLFPERFNEEDIDKLNNEVFEIISSNIKTTKWSLNVLSDSTDKSSIDRIIELKQKYDSSLKKVSNQDRMTILNLRINGESIGLISKSTGFSKSTIHSIINSSESKNNYGK